MGALVQPVLPFKLEATDEMLTANAGLALFGDLIQGLGFSRWLEQEMPLPGSGWGYMAPFYVKPLMLMLMLHGWRTLARRPAHPQERYCTVQLAATEDAALYGCDGRLVAPHRSGRGVVRPLPPQPAGSSPRGSGKPALPPLRWMLMPAKSSPRKKLPTLPTRANKAICP
jgi:hypothetical protein